MRSEDLKEWREPSLFLAGQGKKEQSRQPSMYLLVALVLVLCPQVVEGNAPGLQVPLQLRVRLLARVPIAID